MQIGGSFAAARNVISANSGNGIVLGGGSTRPATIQGNYIGTDSTGTQARGNKASGIAIGTAGNTIGGPNSGDANVIAANGTGRQSSTTGGITLGNFGNGISADNNLIQGNLIGTGRRRRLASGECRAAGSSSRLDASNNQVAANTIAYNNTSDSAVGGGIAFEYSVDSAIGDRIDGNSIFANTGLGIDLGDDGVTPNTPGGPHAGPNDLQNFPVHHLGHRATAVTRPSSARSTPPRAPPSRSSSSATRTADPSGYGQGKTYLGELTGVTTDSKGNASFSASIRTRRSALASSSPPRRPTRPETRPSSLRTSSRPWLNPLIVTTHRRQRAGLAASGHHLRQREPRRRHDHVRDPRHGGPDDRTPEPSAGDHRTGHHRRLQPAGRPCQLARTRRLRRDPHRDQWSPHRRRRVCSPRPETGSCSPAATAPSVGWRSTGSRPGRPFTCSPWAAIRLRGTSWASIPTGTVAKPDQVGVQVETANNTIGGTTPADRDVVSANTFAEVYLFGSRRNRQHGRGRLRRHQCRGHRLALEPRGRRRC